MEAVKENSLKMLKTISFALAYEKCFEEW